MQSNTETMNQMKTESGKRINPIKTVIAVQRKVKRGTNLSIEMNDETTKKLKKLIAFLDKNEIKYSTKTKEYEDGELNILAFSTFKKMWEHFGSKTGVPARPLQVALSNAKKENPLLPLSYKYEADGVETVFSRFYVLKNADWESAPTAFILDQSKLNK